MCDFWIQTFSPQHQVCILLKGSFLLHAHVQGSRHLVIVVLTLLSFCLEASCTYPLWPLPIPGVGVALPTSHTLGVLYTSRSWLGCMGTLVQAPAADQCVCLQPSTAACGDEGSPCGLPPTHILLVG